MSLEAMKAAREALVRVTSSRVGHLGDHSVYCPQMDKERTDATLTLLDAAIQREEGGGEEPCPDAPLDDMRSCYCDGPGCAADRTPTPPSRAELEGAVGSIMDERSEYLRSRVEEAQPPSGVVSREVVRDLAQGLLEETAEMPVMAGRVLVNSNALTKLLLAALSAPSEPMVTRARAMEACHVAHMEGRVYAGTGEKGSPGEEALRLERCVAPILDGGEEARDGE